MARTLALDFPPTETEDFLRLRLETPPSLVDELLRLGTLLFVLVTLFEKMSILGRFAVWSNRTEAPVLGFARFESLCLIALLVWTEGSRLDLDEVAASEDFARFPASLDLDETTESEDVARFLCVASLDLDETTESEDFARLLWCPVSFDLSSLRLFSSGFEGLLLDFEASLLWDLRGIRFASSFFLSSPLTFFSK
jgi:hypothetical protein